MLLVVIAMLGLPYLVDVAFYGDFTPTHFAQEVVVDETIQDEEGDRSFLSVAQHAPLAREIETVLLSLSTQTCVPTAALQFHDPPSRPLYERLSVYRI
ncbi:MAG TPA: hypothetical protein VIU63_02615 [Nitrospira sp.]